MAELVKVHFIRNAPPYFQTDVAGFPPDKAQELVNLGLAELVVEKAEEVVQPPAAPTQPAKPAKPAAAANPPVEPSGV